MIDYWMWLRDNPSKVLRDNRDQWFDVVEKGGVFRFDHDLDVAWVQGQCLHYMEVIRPFWAPIVTPSFVNLDKSHMRLELAYGLVGRLDLTYARFESQTRKGR